MPSSCRWQRGGSRSTRARRARNAAPRSRLARRRAGKRRRVSTNQPPAVDGDRGAPDPAVRIFLRPMASPLPLGFFAFAVGTTMFTALELGWVPVDQAPVLATIIAAFVVPLEIIPAVLAYWARDVGGATAVGIFGMAWAA